MPKLLLIDDDEEEYELLSTAFREVMAGGTVLYANGCKNIIETITEFKPDIVFLDINMPTVDGIDCLKKIREHKDYQELPVVMYSTSNNKQSVQDSFDNKANLYVVKSYSYQGLLAILEKVLKINWELQKPKQISDFVLA